MVPVSQFINDGKNSVFKIICQLIFNFSIGLLLLTLYQQLIDLQIWTVIKKKKKMSAVLLIFIATLPKTRICYIFFGKKITFFTSNCFCKLLWMRSCVIEPAKYLKGHWSKQPIITLPKTRIWDIFFLKKKNELIFVLS